MNIYKCGLQRTPPKVYSVQTPVLRQAFSFPRQKDPHLLSLCSVGGTRSYIQLGNLTAYALACTLKLPKQSSASQTAAIDAVRIFTIMYSLLFKQTPAQQHSDPDTLLSCAHTHIHTHTWGQCTSVGSPMAKGCKALIVFFLLKEKKATKKKKKSSALTMG